MIRRLLLVLLYPLLGRVFLGLVVGVRCTGRKSLRQYRQFVLAGNHNSHLDSVALLAYMPLGMAGQVHPVAAADYFGGNGLKSRLYQWLVNVVLISREAGRREETIGRMIQLLDQGKSLIIFPEGSRGEADVMQSFKKGIGYLAAARPQVPVIPVYIDGFGKILPKGEKLLLPMPARVYIGEPVRLSSTDPAGITREIEAAVIALKPAAAGGAA